MPPEPPLRKQWLKSLATVPWTFAIGLVMFTVVVGGLISVFNPRYPVTDYFRNVAIVTAALLLAIGGYNGSKLR
jgi:hypothetical protein